MDSRKQTIVGNWKMHGNAQGARQLAAAIAKAPQSADIIICPPFTLITQIQGLPGIKLGAQDCSAFEEGAYTGEVSAAMLKSAGCSHVIVGHSERRQYHHETNRDVQQKAAMAMKHGLVPIICIGESLGERAEGHAERVVGEQLRQSLPSQALEGNFMLAYEPVWAIGSGKTPTADDIARMHAYILNLAAEQTNIKAEAISVLYGGSVKPANAREILHLDGVGGALVGGASLKAEEFCAIIAATNN